MSNANEQIRPPGTNPITTTGGIVVNGKQDGEEMANRTGLLGETTLAAASSVFQREFVLARKRQGYCGRGSILLKDGAIRCFTAFNGATHEDESNFAIVGVATNSAQNQSRRGRELGGRFAILRGGTVTVRCNSRTHIKCHDWVMWRIPREGTPTADPHGKGRILPELCTYDPLECLDNPLRMHAQIKSVLSNVTYANQSHAIQGKLQTTMNCWNSVSSIAYTAVIAAMEYKTKAPVSPKDKMFFAEAFGLTSPSPAVSKTANVAAAKSISAFQKDLLDKIFQMETDPSTGLSFESTNLAAFPLPKKSSGGNRNRTVIARTQKNQFINLQRSFSIMSSRGRSQVVGFALNGCAPGGDLDLCMFRGAV